MKVAYITRAGFGLLGGASSYYVPAIAARHHAVRVLCPVARASREEVVYSNADLDIREVQWNLGNELVVGLFNELYTFDPDIVHVFHSRQCLQVLYSLRGMFPRARWIIDFRSPPVMKRGPAHTALLLRYFLSQFYVDRVFTHSLRTLRDNLPLCFRRVHEVPPGVELSAFSPRPPAGAPRRYLYIGSISGVRCLDVLVNAFAKFARGRRPQPWLDLVGGGDALEPLRALVRRSGYGDLVGLPGALPQREVYRRLGDYDAGIAWVPIEIFSRAPSLKMLEYSAAGLPFIASNTIGHRDYARRFGFRFAAFDNSEAGLIEALENVARGGAAANIETNLAAVSRFDWRRIVEEDMLPIYDELCPAEAARAGEAA